VIRITFHAHTINKLVRRLKDSGKYDTVNKNIEYKISEMDVVAMRRVKNKNYMLVFEVKSTYNSRRKAMTQLEKHKRTFEDRVDKIFKLYVTPKYDTSKKEYQIEWIKSGAKYDRATLSKNDLKRIKAAKRNGMDWKILHYF